MSAVTTLTTLTTITPVTAMAPPASAATQTSQRRPALLPCHQDDGALWFAEKPEDLETAKALCGRCPLQVDCLDGALQRGEPWGVWGGQLFDGGRVVPRKRPRGRPRKEVVA